MLTIEQSAFFRLLEAEPALVRGLLSGLTLRLAGLTRRLAELTGARVETRFARLFLKLCDQIGKPDRGGVFIPMPLARRNSPICRDDHRNRHPHHEPMAKRRRAAHR